ncbi:MAG TPA: hypothetical protein VLC55_00720, partial [Burkholderiales bacterium]|nr:hypothetical protein [Burkholderiales bacterium]
MGLVPAGVIKAWPGWPTVVLLGALAAVVAVYWGALGYPLVFDDRPLLSEEILTAYARSFFTFHLRWFAYASFGWTHAMVGPDWWWYRAGNLAAHLAVMLAAYGLAWRFSVALAGPALPAGATVRLRMAAALGAALFALHPVAVYAVAYVAQRSILFATLFGLLMLLA